MPGSHRLQAGRVAPRGKVVQQLQAETSRSVGDRGRWDAGDQSLRERPARFVRDGSPDTPGAQGRKRTKGVLLI